MVFISDLSRFFALVSLVLASALALALASGIMFTTLFLSILLLPYVTSMVVLLLLVHYAYQQYQTRPLYHGFSTQEEEEAYYGVDCPILAAQDATLEWIPMDDQFESDYTTIGSVCLNTPALVITGEDIDTAVQEGSISPMPTNDLPFAIPMEQEVSYATEELNRDGYCLLAMVPSYPLSIAPVDSQASDDDSIDIGDVGSLITVHDDPSTIPCPTDVYSILTQEELVTLARTHGIKGVSVRWRRDTIIQRIKDKLAPAQMVA